MLLIEMMKSLTSHIWPITTSPTDKDGFGPKKEKLVRQKEGIKVKWRIQRHTARELWYM